MNASDTIAAISSATGPAARMIVRLGGPEARRIGASLAPGACDGAGASRAMLHITGLRMPAWVYTFIAPHSYNGDDLVELHLPGNVLLVRLILQEAIRHGAREALPGEFTARAFINGRMDLAAAEGVAATIAAQGEQELSAARQLLAGELSRRLRPILDRLADTLALVEAGIDFSDEQLSFLNAEQLAARVDAIDEALRRLVEQSVRFEQLAHEPRLVLAGRPSAGKSTLLNALAGHGRAVVSPLPGTTRDILSAHVALDRGMVILMDAAGLDGALPPDDDPSPQAAILHAMRRRSLDAIASADRVLLVHDATDARPPLGLPRAPDLVVHTKIDLAPVREADDRSIGVSAMTGENLPELRRRLCQLAFGEPSGAAALALNARHLAAIEESRAALARTRGGGGDELQALALREALNALGTILGEVSPDDILGRVFSTFCIGK